MQKPVTPIVKTFSYATVAHKKHKTGTNTLDKWISIAFEYVCFYNKEKSKGQNQPFDEYQ